MAVVLPQVPRAAPDTVGRVYTAFPYKLVWGNFGAEKAWEGEEREGSREGREEPGE